MISADEICQTAIETMKERGKAYDDKQTRERSMASVVAAFNAATGHQLTEEQGWHFMTILKIVRSQQGDYKADNYVDGTAYFALAGECADRHAPPKRKIVGYQEGFLGYDVPIYEDETEQ
ncbi:DUF6378 domain-containing protein [Moraxella sp. ZJ142]|uniref:DUF6378 domain-containing protein n=1 Tax=Moraxella marmotae TaxID=3344520 RepID=UPI0035D43DD3